MSEAKETAKTPNDGGSAFPIQASDLPGSYGAECGMTLRDYFAAHSSPMPEEWPQAKRPPYALPKHNFTSDKLAQFKGWGDYLDDSEIKPEWLAEFQEFKRKQEEYVRQYTMACMKAEAARQAAWDWAYADAMLAAREAK